MKEYVMMPPYMSVKEAIQGPGGWRKEKLLFFVPQPRPRELGRRLRYNKQGKHPFNLLTIFINWWKRKSSLHVPLTSMRRNYNWWEITVTTRDIWKSFLSVLSIILINFRRLFTRPIWLLIGWGTWVGKNRSLPKWQFFFQKPLEVPASLTLSRTLPLIRLFEKNMQVRKR